MWQYNYSNELYHYGVLGMKWGKRKAAKYTKKSEEYHKRAWESAEKTAKIGGIILEGRSYRDPAAELLVPEYDRLENETRSYEKMSREYKKKAEDILNRLGGIKVSSL